MQRTVTRPLALFIAFALIIASMPFAFAQAHGDEDHSAEAPKHEKTVAELEQMLALLKQLVALLQEQRALQGTATISPTAISTITADHHDDEDTEEGHDHGDADSDEGDNDDTKTFAIEVEEHNGKTHVHARYIDKPEEQFYVDADIDDEEDLIEAIHEHTGLPESVIEPAIVYL